MNRRDFITKAGATAASGLIPWDFYRHAREFLHNHDLPLIVAPPKPKTILWAGPGDDGMSLYLGGDPETGPPPLSWREFLEDWRGEDLASATDVDLDESWGITRAELDDPAAEYHVWDQWVISEGPAACAHHYLQGLNLGPDLVGRGRVIGRLMFVEGPFPGSNDTFVQAEDPMTLSCLQERLNRLGEGIEVRVWEG